jgi:putative toxin-antitoxin system antitoxin component (TIGR02293 family)
MDVSTTNPAIWTRALELFGDEQKVIRWLATPLSELNDRTPEQVLRDAPGGEEVSAILDRIDYGVFS